MLNPLTHTSHAFVDKYFIYKYYPCVKLFKQNPVTNNIIVLSAFIGFNCLNRREWGRLDLWVRWTTPKKIIVAGAFFYPSILKRPLVVSLSTKMFHGDCMRCVSGMLCFLTLNTKSDLLKISVAM